MAAVQNGVEVYLPLKGLIDVELETARLNKEKTGLEKELKRVEGKLGNAGFWRKRRQRSWKRKKRRPGNIRPS